MSGRIAFAMIAAVVAAACEPFYASGRQLEPWPYDKLFKHADLVVVAKVVSVEDAGIKVAEKAPDDYLVGVITTFEVSYVIKGEYKAKRLSVFHFRLSLTEGQGVLNGPRLVAFHARRMDIQHRGGARSLAEPEYMLFLKKRKDAYYECVSGQFDAEPSVKQLITPLPDPGRSGR